MRYIPQLDERKQPTGNFLKVKEEVVTRLDLESRKTELEAQIDSCDVEATSIAQRKAELQTELTEIITRLG